MEKEAGEEVLVVALQGRDEYKVDELRNVIEGAALMVEVRKEVVAFKEETRVDEKPD